MSRRFGRLAAALVLALAAASAPARADEPQASPTPAPEETPASRRTLREVVGTILGRVYDTRNKPVVGWMVELSSKGQEAMLRVTGTNEKGEYVFKDLPAGVYDIEVGAGTEGSKKKGKIEVRPPFRNIVDFQIGADGDKGNAGLNPLEVALKKRVPGGPSGAPAAPGATAPPGSAAAPSDAPAGGPPQTVPVRGLFLDSEKRPIAEVQVTFAALEGKGIYQASSGDDGVFTIPAVLPGSYRVQVMSPGYVALELKSVEVAPASGLNLSLSLVGYPLNFKGRPQDLAPREDPLPAPPERP